METFLAVTTDTRAKLTDEMVKIIEHLFKSLSTDSTIHRATVSTVRHEGTILFALQREEASDVVFTELADGTVVYVQGCVEPLEASNYDTHLNLAVDKMLPKCLFGDDVEGRGSALESLTGSFHLAIYDPATKELLAATDRQNSRVLFYYSDSSMTVISSDIRAILMLPGVDRAIDLEAIAQFARTQTLFGARTLYTRVKSLMPGSAIRASEASPNPTVHRYWHLTPLSPFSSDGDAVEATADAFERAAVRTARGSEQAGVLLSGGLDSRVILTLVHDLPSSVQAYTFGPTLTDEGTIAKRVAGALGVEWRLVAQSPDDYWRHVEHLLPALQSLHSVAHTHPFRTALTMRQNGVDTIYHGLELCVTFSGSYLPKSYRPMLGRKVFTYQLAQLGSKEEVKQRLLTELDVNAGRFEWSYLGNPMLDHWQNSASKGINEAVDRASGYWADPYDQYEKAVLDAGFAKFRSYSVASSNRYLARERTIMPDAEVIDVYRRLTVDQRFLGPVYRQAMRSLNPELAAITYPNVGTSPFASARMQAATLQARQLWRANRQRAVSLLGTLGVDTRHLQKRYGSYPSPGELVRSLASANSQGAASVRRALDVGPLTQSGIVDGKRVLRRMNDPTPMSNDEATSILAVATLAAWFDRYPGEL